MSQQYRKIRLDNGLRIVAYHMPNMQSVGVGIWIKVGSRYESDKNKGISHYLEHMLFKGSKDYSCRKIKESIEGVGGSLNGFTSEELTCYLAKIPSYHLELTLDVLSDMVLNPSLPKLELEKEKQVILEEIKMYKDLPQSYVQELLDQLLWPNQPLGEPIIGTVDSVSRITREDLCSFQQEYYTVVNIVVSAVGLLDYDKLAKKVTKTFSTYKEKKLNEFSEVKEEQSRPQLKLFHKDTEQTHLALGFHSVRRDHSLRHALGLMHIILGANMSSRLFHELREKRGLAYEIGTQVKRFQDTGSFIVHAGIDNYKVVEATRLILQELVKIKEKLVNKDEFKRAKEFYVGQLMLALEDTLEHMLWIGETTAALDKIFSLNDIMKQINQVKREDIQKVARFVFQERKLNLALIGSLKEKEQDIYKQLKMD